MKKHLYAYRTLERLFLDTAALFGYEEYRLSGDEPFAEEGLLPVRGVCCRYGDAPVMGAWIAGVDTAAGCAELISLAAEYLGALGFADAAVRLCASVPEGLREYLEEMNLSVEEDFAAPEENTCFSVTAFGKEVVRGSCGQFWIEEELLLDSMREAGVAIPEPDPFSLYILPEEGTEAAALRIAADLRSEGFAVRTALVPAERDLLSDGAGARFVMELSRQALQLGRAGIRDVSDGTVSQVELDGDLTQFFYNRELDALTGELEGLSFSFAAK